MGGHDGRKVSRQDITKVLKQKARENQDQEQILVPVRSVKTRLEIDKGLEVSEKTIRSRGVSMDGYYTEKYPDACSYNKKGDPMNWGLLIKPELFLEQVNEEKGGS